MKTIHKMIPLAVVATFACGSSAVRANGLTPDQGDRIAKKCQAAANFVNTNDPGTILFRPITHKGVWWCAVTDREGTLLAIRSSDTNENGCGDDEFNSDAARLSELIAIAKAWTTSFSNSEVAVDSRGVGLGSRIDDEFPPTFGNTTGTNAGPGALWGVWATNLFRNSERANGYTCGKRHFGVVAFAGGQPVYDCKSHKLVGGAGASGDSVDADDLVTKQAISLAGFCITPTQTSP